MENEIILQKLNRIEKYICGLKNILNVEELTEYTGFKKSFIYKLVHEAKIPYSKPNGKMLFFEKKKIDEWLLQNSHKPESEIKLDAFRYKKTR
ncbi:helix-turn-helix transcriptional regulator [Echinicola vietnamensis]|uniref:DNA-binding protein, excisionase family n=1 Tax=Echinicola vietnamensis (strain DSM 17526 / LMG 23754 / KMM 6221) TaxID=926556 RepID=L0G346_ECHVK|nr:helix-turn-helix domain-containing protein [Echinicola vietnamensis]AGA79728.1 DNA-binding protein, excisionase family [Echinicola vietnamensis DSM 17526]